MALVNFLLREPFGKSLLVEVAHLKKSTAGAEKKKRYVVDAALASRTHDLEEANKTASFVAHELNNLLTVIQINTEFLLESSGENPASAEELDEIQIATKRASILARQLLASSRLEPFDPRVAAAALKQKPKKPEPPEKAPRVGETILLVEDEAAVRSLAKRILAQHGYRVLEAADGSVALRLAASHVGEIDLVLTDVEMPNLGGRGMVEEMRELSPGLPVLYMSGYSKEELFPDKERRQNTPYVQKPFTGDTLLAEIRATLGYAT